MLGRMWGRGTLLAVGTATAVAVGVGIATLPTSRWGTSCRHSCPFISATSPKEAEAAPHLPPSEMLGAAVSSARPRTLRIATFNMLAHPYTKHNVAHHRHNIDGSKLESDAQRDTRYALNQTVIASVDADVLLVQEHDAAVNVPRYVAGARAFAHGRSEGCSVLFKPELVHTGMVNTWVLDCGEGKTAAAATCDGVPGVLFVSVHLKGGPGAEPVRAKQMESILEHVGTSTPCVLAGDMNDTAPDSTFGELMTAHGFTRVPYAGFSGLTSAMDVPLAIDHVYVRGVKVTDVTLPYTPGIPWRADAAVGSDHVPVCVQVAVNANAS